MGGPVLIEHLRATIDNILLLMPGYQLQVQVKTDAELAPACTRVCTDSGAAHQYALRNHTAAAR